MLGWEGFMIGRLALFYFFEGKSIQWGYEQEILKCVVYAVSTFVFVCMYISMI
jgi:hypothetical protein